MKTVLVADDNEKLQQTLTKFLKLNNFCPINALSIGKAISLFKQKRFSIILLDQNMPDGRGMNAIKKFQAIDKDIPIVMITGYGDVTTAVEAMKLGAKDFIPKPINYKRLLAVLNILTHNSDFEDSQKTDNEEKLLCTSKAFIDIINQVNIISKSDFSIILEGETGTGKSYLANYIHSRSNRSKNPFVKVDVGRIPDSLVEAELFGYVKGAFTGADKDRKGYFELADKGTIFLDEIENMSLYVQSKLLSFAEDGKVYPLGQSNSMGLDLRIITATNQDIKTKMVEREFRKDLFYRIGEFVITVPPLRERIEDIVSLFRYFLKSSAKKLNKTIEGFSEDSMRLLTGYSWPGNIRELKMVANRAVLLCNNKIIRPNNIVLSNLTTKKKESASFSLKKALAEIEKDMVEKALLETKGNKSKAASILEIDYKTLLSKIAKHHI